MKAVIGKAFQEIDFDKIQREKLCLSVPDRLSAATENKTDVQNFYMYLSSYVAHHFTGHEFCPNLSIHGLYGRFPTGIDAFGKSRSPHTKASILIKSSIC